MKKIVIVGGHLSPALATIEELRKSKNAEIIFLGRKYSSEGSKEFSAEYETIRKMGIKFYALITGRLQRKFTLYTIPSLIKIPFGFLQALALLTLEKPSVVVTFGGYLSTPATIAAWLLGIKSIAHEQASVPGLATKINSTFASKIFLTWEDSKKYFSKQKKLEVIGNLMRDFKRSTNSLLLKKFIHGDKKVLLFMGGNLGSHLINSLMFSSKDLFRDYKVIHLLGTTNYQGDHKKAQELKSQNYLPFVFLNTETYGQVLASTDLVISRSGANTIWELALFKKPAILFPLKIAARGEQLQNAKVLEEAGTAKIASENGMTPEALKTEIQKVFTNYHKYLKNAEEFSKKLPKYGARKFTKYILSYT